MDDVKEARNKFERAIGLLSLELPDAVYRDFTRLADEFFAALSARPSGEDAARSSERPEIRVGDSVRVPQWLYVRNNDDLQTDWSSALAVCRHGKVIWRKP